MTHPNISLYIYLYTIYVRMRTNVELDNLLVHADVVRYIVRDSVGLDTTSEWKKNGCLRRY
jgi:hypothetical protein